MLTVKHTDNHEPNKMITMQSNETISDKVLKPLPLSYLLDSITTVIDEKQAQRVFHGRGHAYKNLDHISIDCLYPVVLVTLFAPISTKDLSLLTRASKKCFPSFKSIRLQHRYQPHWPVETLYSDDGNDIEQLEIIENDLKFHLEFQSGKNTGLFLDMRNGREWVQNHSANKRVINLFSYTCGFSVAAIAGGARSVYNIDISRSVLSKGRENHRLNQHSLEKCRFEKLNIFKSFGRIERNGPYDLLICDPPTFQKGSIDIVRDYPKLIKRLHSFMSEDGILLMCINTPHLGQKSGREFLLEAMQAHAPEFSYQGEITPPDVYVETQDKGCKVLIFRC